MNELIITYVIFTYLYMSHRFINKVKNGVPDDIKDYVIESGLIVSVILLLSPLIFILHVITGVIRYLKAR